MQQPNNKSARVCASRCAAVSACVEQNVVLYTGDAADRALIQQHELRFAGDPKASKRAKFNVLLVLHCLQNMIFAVA